MPLCPRAPALNVVGTWDLAPPKARAQGGVQGRSAPTDLDLRLELLRTVDLGGLERGARVECYIKVQFLETSVHFFQSFASNRQVAWQVVPPTPEPTRAVVLRSAGFASKPEGGGAAVKPKKKKSTD